MLLLQLHRYFDVKMKAEVMDGCRVAPAPTHPEF